jgi:hypothetical protein
MHRGIRIFIFSILFILLMAGCIYVTVSSIQSMQFQLTHPITRARVLSVFTHTYTTVDGGGCSAYDPQTGGCSAYFPQTQTTHTETCAARISFRANGQDIEVDVREMLVCGVEVGDQPKIAYDPRQPRNLQFVPGGDPFWGNLLGILLLWAFAGFFLTVGVGLLHLFSERAFRVGVVFWVIALLGIIALDVMNGINLNP